MKTAQKKLENVASDSMLNGITGETVMHSVRNTVIKRGESFTNSDLYFIHKKYKRVSIRTYLN